MDLNRREVLRWAVAPLFAGALPALASVANPGRDSAPNAGLDRVPNPGLDKVPNPGLDKAPNTGLGDVFFCRVSHENLLPIAQSLCPRSIASCEPRPGFHGITFCGSHATLTVPADQLS